MAEHQAALQTPDVISLNELAPFPTDVGEYIGVIQKVSVRGHDAITPVDRIIDKSIRDSTIEQASGDGIPEGVLQTEESFAKSGELQLLHDVMNQETMYGEVAEWSTAARNLLIRSQTVPDEERDIYIVGAVTAAQFTPDADMRREFVKYVYDFGLQTQVGDACERSSIALLFGKPNDEGKIPIHKIEDFASAFRIDNRYLQAYLAPGTKSEGPSAHKRQKELTEQIASGAVDEAVVTQAAVSSVQGEKVGGGVLDTTKIERFALQQFFIRKQMLALLDNEDPTRTSFSRSLADRHAFSPVAHAVNSARHARRASNLDLLDENTRKLNADVSNTFMDLTNEVAGQFALDGVDTSNRASLTEEQGATLRYHYVTEQIVGQNALSRFVDFESFAERSKDTTVGPITKEDNDQIWSNSFTGAGLPGLASGLVRNAARGALNSSFANTISPEELRDFTQRSRSTLLALAGRNIEEAPADNSAPDNVVLRRNEKGELELDNDFVLPDKDALELYSAVTLGCPALREQNPSRKVVAAEERIANGSANYIDQLLAAVINEAFERGMFNLRPYQLPHYPGRHRAK